VDTAGADPEPFAWWSAEAPSPTPERALGDLVELRASLNRIETLLVARARANGATWAEIGGQLGITRQSAHRRHRVRQPAVEPGVR